MRVLLLNGALGPDPLLDALADHVRGTCEAQGDVVETVLPRVESVAWCQGCFECWTRTPGLCKIADDGRDLAHEFVRSDLVLLLTPVSFGGWSSEAKKVLDRTLGVLLPFFHKVGGEVHHFARYATPPAFGVVAVMDVPDFDTACTVRVLAERNAINFAAPAHDVCVVTRADDPSVVQASVDTMVASLRQAIDGHPRWKRRRITHPDALLPAMARIETGVPPHRALLLVGSAKPTGTSTSEVLGMEILERLAMHGVEGAVRHVHRDVHDDAGRAQFVADVRAHDLLVIAAPVYIDALPSLVTAALETLAADRKGAAEAPPLTVAMVLNCGFPEAKHAAVARTIGALFARDVHAAWAGALQLGGGTVLSGRALAEGGPLTKHLAGALDDAAAQLARGERFSDAVLETFQRPLMPAGVYMAAADANWLWTAAHEGALGALFDRPLETVAR